MVFQRPLTLLKILGSGQDIYAVWDAPSFMLLGQWRPQDSAETGFAAKNQTSMARPAAARAGTIPSRSVLILMFVTPSPLCSPLAQLLAAVSQ